MGTPAGRPHVRPPAGVRLRGSSAQVWAGGKQAGVLYRWSLDGADGAWTAEVAKYRLFEPVAGEAELHFFLTPEGAPQVLELHAIGHLLGARADGEMHRDGLKLKGTRLWIPQAEQSNGSS